LEATTASLELPSERYRFVFYYRGARFLQTLKTTDPTEAEECRARSRPLSRRPERTARAAKVASAGDQYKSYA
jgi:hypothetical protein